MQAILVLVTKANRLTPICRWK